MRKYIEDFGNFIDKGPARAAAVIFLILLAVCILAALVYDPPKPAPGVEAWFKLFQSVVAVVVGLKIAWNIQPVMKALAESISKAAPKDKG